ncbi:OmpA family protein [Larkinella rosea]|uniref:OmpA family protein n=2 Tax=Larkinella rosea TaxID=2025312 RepID=A0A3P1BVA8_9BACT|nr:OmpA family protein [Larkinella rosea]
MAEVKVAAPVSPPVNTDLSTLTTGKTVTLNNVYFDQSSYLLRPESYTQLNQLVALLKSRPGLRIEISGHTDNVGDPRLNLALSENRARVITSYLITNGISENRLRFKGYGQTQPITANDTEENKRKNRRVEVKLLDG